VFVMSFKPVRGLLLVFLDVRYKELSTSRPFETLKGVDVALITFINDKQKDFKAMQTIDSFISGFVYNATKKSFLLSSTK
jgi:hypothetical protein